MTVATGRRAPSRKKWRVGLLGLGHWYSAWSLARALVDYPRAELVAVADPETRHREEFARVFGVDAYPDPASLLEQAEVHVVQLAPPVSEMAEYTRLAAAAGKHVVLGKPMAMTAAEAEQMVAAVEAAGIVCVAFHGIGRLRSAALKARLDDGLVGRILLMHATARSSIAEDWYSSGRPGWFADPTRVPGGALVDEGICLIDEMRWLAGSEVVQVEARTANLVHGDIRVEDWGLATLTFADGVVATLEASWIVTAPRRSGPSPKHNGTLRLEIVGARGEVVEDRLHHPGLDVLAAGAPGWVRELSSTERFGPSVPQPLDHLLDCVESGREPVATAREAHRSLVVALAAYESAWKQRPVTISW